MAGHSWEDESGEHRCDACVEEIDRASAQMGVPTQLIPKAAASERVSVQTARASIALADVAT